ncbi:MAG TPA: hypothetical protein VGO21_01760, partial [Candidatus Paceibacterota bacterium]|nr:hypothetical protein [Candidatus Paceibacterota bacterium]
MTINKLNDLPAELIKEKLLSATIGGQGDSSNRLGQEAQDIFTFYVRKALNDAVEVKEVTLLQSKASLNSIMAHAV